MLALETEDYGIQTMETAAFNLNLLERLRRELHAEIEPDRFLHQAFFNETPSRIEMHLASQLDQIVIINGVRFRFRTGESLHTENSYKYTLEGFRGLSRAGGFHARAHWADRDALFSEHCLERA